MLLGYPVLPISGIVVRDDSISIQTSYRSAEAPQLSHSVKLHVVLDANRTGGVCVQGGQFGIKHQVVVALSTCDEVENTAHEHQNGRDEERVHKVPLGES